MKETENQKKQPLPLKPNLRPGSGIVQESLSYLLKAIFMPKNGKTLFFFKSLNRLILYKQNMLSEIKTGHVMCRCFLQFVNYSADKSFYSPLSPFRTIPENSLTFICPSVIDLTIFKKLTQFATYA